VLVTDDPHRTYRTRTGSVPGDLVTVTVTVTDSPTGRAWRFIPDFTTPGDGWLLLDRCPGCEAEVPVTRIACLAELGEYLDPDGDPHLADETRDEVLHQPRCTFALPTVGNRRPAPRDRQDQVNGATPPCMNVTSASNLSRPPTYIPGSPPASKAPYADTATTRPRRCASPGTDGSTLSMLLTEGDIVTRIETKPGLPSEDAYATERRPGQ
jgi:hypothetical protein